MQAAEFRSRRALASVFGLRMLGMFLILPVFVLYATDLPGATPVLIGLALGIYGLTQGLLQIPLGWLSDRVGRKPVIAGGLLLFAAGSVVAAAAPDITWTILGRALQGTGAVAAALAALLADVTRAGVRTRAMAVVGVTIGVSFGLSMVLGPVLDAWIGVRGIFWLTAGLALLAIAVVLWVVPAEPRDSRAAGGSASGGSASGGSASVKRDSFLAVFRNRSLRHLFVGIFSLHFILTAVFIAVPQALAAAPLLDGRSHAWVYLPVLLVSVVLMAPMVINGDRPALRRPLLLGNVALLIVGVVVMMQGHGHSWWLILGLLAFFTAFNYLEAHHPAAVSQVAPMTARGAALGVYSSCQFLGAFAGGAVGGLVWSFGGAMAVFAAAAVVAGLWLSIVARK